MTRIKLIIILTFLSFIAFGQDDLYPIKKGNLWGYIDKTGKEVIPPQFKSAGPFFERLAAVRLNGTYGYIDQTGNFTIKPKFDLALPFENGLAKVYLDGKPFIIDRSGNISFDHNFESIDPFENRTYTIAITPTNKYCLINRKGKLITDTNFSDISLRSYGIAVVKSFKDKSKVGVIDTTGKWIIEYGKYKDFYFDFNKGYATAERYDQTREESLNSRHDAVLNKKGKLLFIIPTNQYFLAYMLEEYSDGLAVVRMMPKNWQDYENYYRGVINTNGKLLYTDTNWRKITPFTYKRAFVKDKKGQWKLINEKGLMVGKSTFNNIMNEPSLFFDTTGIFTNGIAWVKLSDGWVKLDTLGNVLSQPLAFEGISDSRLYRMGDIIIFGRDKSFGNYDKHYPYGFWNSKTNSFVKPEYDYIQWSDFKYKELIYAKKGRNSYYLNSDGKVIWQGIEDINSKRYNLNIDFMNKNYFYIHRELSLKKMQSIDSLRLVDSTNFFIKSSKSLSSPKTALHVIVNPKIKDTSWGNINARAVYIGNNSDKEIKFYVNQYRLSIKVQACNSRGEWRDIEFLPKLKYPENDQSTYPTFDLPARKYMTFLTPVYEGEFKTKLRIEVKYIDPADDSYSFWGKNEITVYSNEYEGSINPGQFWNQ